MLKCFDSVKSFSPYRGEFKLAVLDILFVKVMVKGEKAQEYKAEVSRCPMCPEEENSNKLLFAMILSLFTN